MAFRVSDFYIGLLEHLKKSKGGGRVRLQPRIGEKLILERL